MPDRSESYPETFVEELNIQSTRIMIPLSLIAVVAWLPYIPLDLKLNPDEPLIIILRCGLSFLGIVLLALQLIPRIRVRALILMIILGAYLEISTAVITALSKPEMNYIGGYLFVLMLVPLVPLPKRWQVTIVTVSIISFFTVGILYRHITFDSQIKIYSMNDLGATVAVSLFFIFSLNSMRFRSWQKSKWIETQKSSMQRANDELLKKNEHIVVQQKEIEIRNKILETELHLAKNIQKQLIPSTYHDANIHSLYKPMDMVGGDFFDFIRFRDSSQIGIFISDVSGHGVPAAFVTAIIKSLILNSGIYKTNPAKLLLFLNDVLPNLAGGNFITAFYGIYDFRTKKFAYANAGHNFPYLLNGDSITIMSGKSGPPLALWTNVELQKMRKAYMTNEEKLPKDTKILFYTDGLTDAVNPAMTKVMYGDALFEKNLFDSRHLKPEEIVNQLFRSLVDFRGNDNFEDDVCIICFDIKKKEK